MQVEYTPAFERDIEKLKDDKVLLRLKSVLSITENAGTLKDIPNVKKLLAGKKHTGLR